MIKAVGEMAGRSFGRAAQSCSQIIVNLADVVMLHPHMYQSIETKPKNTAFLWLRWLKTGNLMRFCWSTPTFCLIRRRR